MKHKLQNQTNKAESIFGLCYLAAQQFAVPFLLALVMALLGFSTTELWLNFIFFAFNFLVVAVAFHRYLLADLRIFSKNLFSVLGLCVVGFVVYWAANIFAGLVIALYFPDFANPNDANIQAMADDRFWVMFTGSVILVPLVEETLYRGVLFGLADRINRPLAYILSTLAFALIHVVGYVGTVSPLYLLVSMLQYVPAGLCLSWAYARSNTIFAPVLIHTAVNFLGMLAMR